MGGVNELSGIASDPRQQRIKDIEARLRRARRQDRDDVPQEPHVRAYYKELKQAESDIAFLLTTLVDSERETRAAAFRRSIEIVNDKWRAIWIGRVATNNDLLLVREVVAAFEIEVKHGK